MDHATKAIEPPKAQTKAEAMTSEWSHTIDDLERVLSKCEEAIERLQGSLPDRANEKGDSVHEANFFGSLAAQQMRLRNSVNRLHTLSDVLEEVV